VFSLGLQPSHIFFSNASVIFFIGRTLACLEDVVCVALGGDEFALVRVIGPREVAGPSRPGQAGRPIRVPQVASLEYKWKVRRDFSNSNCYGELELHFSAAVLCGSRSACIQIN